MTRPIQLLDRKNHPVKLFKGLESLQAHLRMVRPTEVSYWSHPSPRGGAYLLLCWGSDRSCRVKFPSIEEVGQWVYRQRSLWGTPLSVDGIWVGTAGFYRPWVTLV